MGSRRNRNRPSPYAPPIERAATGHQEPTQRNRHGKASESRLAANLGMRETYASGALAFDKGDATKTITINGDVVKIRMECKSTTSASLSVKKEWLDKILSEAIARGEVPMFSMSFVDENGAARDANSDWFAMPMSVMKQILGGGE